MAIQHRESFLNNVAAKLNRPRKKSAVTKPIWRKQPQWDVLKGCTQEQLIQVLEKQCKVIHTSFKRTNKNTLANVLYETILEYGGKSIITAEDERNNLYGLPTFFDCLGEEKIDIHVWNSDKGEENVIFAEQANIGITFSDMTLAESGTVTLFNDKNNSRSISLLPKHYIAIIPKETIVPRMSQATKTIHDLHEAGHKIASSISFITGPSNSADIELNLVVGVHGPIKATYIVVE